MGKKLNNNITMLEEEFCKLFVSADSEFFGNGTQSYIEAFNVDLHKKGAYLVSRVQASKLLTKPNILKRINQLLEDVGLNDLNVDKQLYMVINQCADLSSKVAAIREYNKLKKRIEDNSLTLPQTLTINVVKTYIKDK
jgi:hypothetical protein